MDLYPAVLAFLKDHGLHKTATMLEREADCQIPVEAHPNLLDLFASHLKRSRESEESDGPPSKRQAPAKSDDSDSDSDSDDDESDDDSDDSDESAKPAAASKPAAAAPGAGAGGDKDSDSDSDDDAFGEPMRRDGLIADDRRLGAGSDEGAYLGWCRTVLPPSKDTNGSAVDKWEVEVKSDEVEVRHSCSTDGDRGVATVFLVPARSYEIRSRCRNSAGWSRWSQPLIIKTP